MRATYLFALIVPLAACASAGGVQTKSAPAPAPYGVPCEKPCTVRVVNQSALPLTVLAASADGTRVLGTVPAQKESAFTEAVLSPEYLASPDAASGDVAVTCTNATPRAGENVLLVCK